MYLMASAQRQALVVDIDQGTEDVPPQPLRLSDAIRRGSQYYPLGDSQTMKIVRRLLEQVAGFNTNVLITGESGTGKEWAARYVHAMSPRARQAFVPVNCGAIPADLLESELFGHEKGAFTGAITQRIGRFEAADGGTLFLDEIGDMALPMQVKVLRVIQERLFERIGSSRSRCADVRLIAATHKNLERAINEGAFREDLFYRLNVFPIELPALRDRVEDLPLLVENILANAATAGLQPVRLGGSAMRALMAYPWPGNIRELANLLERLCILYPGDHVEAVDLPQRYTRLEFVGPVDIGQENDRFDSSFAESDSAMSLKSRVEDFEMTLIRKALADAQGVVSHAAKLLQLNRTTLTEKIRRYQIEV
jgi:sigma-54 dependent transcriptional regulator, flagellar regulatory protein